jgi:hypothetical protein
MNAISREPAKAMLRDGQLFQLNGTLRFPKCLSVAQAREVAYLFGRDFEDKTSAVPVMAPLPVNGGVGVHTADLAAWLDTLPDTEQSLCFELAGFSTLHGLHPESADEMLYSDTLTPDQRQWLTRFIERWNAWQDADDDAHTAAIEDAFTPARAIALTGQELATILAALRYYQEQGMGDPDNRSNDIHDIATNGDNEVSLDADGIDALCERLNVR